MSVPSNLHYADTHEWVKVEGQECLVGLTQHAVELLGDVVYLELPKVGATLTQSAAIGVVESVKAASDIYTPVSGKVMAVNEALAADPGLLNQDCYANWLYRLELTSSAEVDGLMSAVAYSAAIA